MNYTKDSLSKKELSFLLEQLSITEVLTEENMDTFKESHPYILNRSILKPTEITVYSMENKKLNEWLASKLSKNNIIESLYIMDYEKATFSKKHNDGLRKVAIVLLTDDFDGGRFLIEDKDVSLTNVGEYVVFDGCTHQHEVTEITRGSRKVLVMFFKNETEINEIIEKIKIGN